MSLGQAANRKVPTTGKGRWAWRIWVVVSSVIAMLVTLWASMALYFDFPLTRFRPFAAVAYVLGTIAIALLAKAPLARMLAALLCCACLLVWWFSLKPSNHGPWQKDVSQTAWATVSGNGVTIHNIRDCDYRTELDYTCAWETRTVALDHIQGVDLFMDYWGSPWIAHTILSFALGDGEHLAFSIEARRRVGQNYSSVRSFFRQYTLISVVSGERDVVRLRTNYRHGEDLYLYHTRATPGFARELFMSYIALTNQLHEKPQWYNALTHNCTTEIYTLAAMKDRSLPWRRLDWRILLNGKADEMEYEHGDLAADGLGWRALKQRALINPAASAANDAADFSTRIRENRPGFTLVTQ